LKSSGFAYACKACSNNELKDKLAAKTGIAVGDDMKNKQYAFYRCYLLSGFPMNGFLNNTGKLFF